MFPAFFKKFVSYLRLTHNLLGSASFVAFFKLNSRLSHLILMLLVLFLNLCLMGKIFLYGTNFGMICRDSLNMDNFLSVF